MQRPKHHRPAPVGRLWSAIRRPIRSHSGSLSWRHRWVPASVKPATQPCWKPPEMLVLYMKTIPTVTHSHGTEPLNGNEKINTSGMGSIRRSSLAVRTVARYSRLVVLRQICPVPQKKPGGKPTHNNPKIDHAIGAKIEWGTIISTPSGLSLSLSL